MIRGCIHSRWLALFFLAFWGPKAADAQIASGRVFLEVPLMVQAPGYREVVRAYHDGKAFFVDIAQLFERLGFQVSRDGPLVTALDASRRIEMDFALLTARSQEEASVSLAGLAEYGGGRYLVSMAGLSRLFASDIHFEEASLSLRLSTAAETFNIGALRRRSPLMSEAPGPLRFGRERHALGGVIANYYLSWRGPKSRPQGSLRFTGSVLGGSVRGRLGASQEISYLFDRPGSRTVTRIEAGRLHGGYFGGLAPLEAVRVSNLPLTSRLLQRAARLRGRTQPHALVEALIAGQVVDRIEADSEGRYVLTAPTYYGSTEALIRISPLGAPYASEERRYLLATTDLIEPGRLYYDAFLGRAQGKVASIAHAEFGLLPRLSLRASGRADHAGRRARLGATLSPVSFGVLSADARLPSGSLRAGAKLWRRSLSMEASYDAARGPAPRKHGLVQLTGAWGRMSGFLTGSFSQAPGSWRSQHVSGSVDYHGPHGASLRLQASAARTGITAYARTHSWRVTAGKAMALAGGAGRLALFARGEQALREGGLEGFASFRRLSLGFTAGYDRHFGGLTGGFALQVNTPVAGASARGRYSGAQFSYTQSLFGSVDLSRRPRLTRGAREESAAVLRLFEDANGDGRYQASESVLPHIQAQLYHGGLERRPDGVLRASYLEPFGRYQVQILEQSIRDPYLRPATGYTFSFVADPGRTKNIDIPMQRVPLVRGSVRGLRRAPSRLKVHVLRGGLEAASAEVYRDGGFALRLEAGRYTVRLMDVISHERLYEDVLYVPPGEELVSVLFELGGAEGQEQ